MVTITQPTNQDIKDWWNWATQFRRGNSPFDINWGGSGVDRTDSHQPIRVYCLSCTAGNGGRDTIPRPLRTATGSQNNILIPVFVAEGGNINEAKTQLGRNPAQPTPGPTTEFIVDGISRQSFYNETNVGTVNFVAGNSFDEPPGDRNVVSAGFWAKVSPDVTTIEFGGNGGRISPTNNAQFDTRVIYRL
jgi:hypothetical protein